MTPAVRLEDVQVAVGGRVLLEVPRLAIESGERVAIIGPNGAGKSTLLRLIGALVEARRGRVEVLGRSIAPGGEADGGHVRQPLSPQERRALRCDTGLLLQGLHLVPRLSARENALIGALGRLRGAKALRSWYRWYPQDLVAEAEAALAALGLVTATARASTGFRAVSGRRSPWRACSCSGLACCWSTSPPLRWTRRRHARYALHCAPWPRRPAGRCSPSCTIPSCCLSWPRA